ncbi:MAG: patatin-like phospholipase family protein [Bacillota bacterium]|nr:patatin-like phospholipase family protein [Bacillota bacterium]
MHRTEIGLALGGGAARGLAHIGVLRELERAGVAVTHVAGCSFGAVVGAAYVAGTLPELERRARSLSRGELVRLADFTLSGGVVGGELLLDRLRELTRDLRFEELPVPFAVLATDLATGEPVVLRTGSVAEAVRASMSVPGLFAPIVLDGRTVVDGGLAELVPVSALRELQPPRVVAVDVSSPYDVWTRAATRARLSVGSARRRWHRLSEAALELGPGRVLAGLGVRDRSDEQNWGLVRTVFAAFDITEDRLRRTPPDASADVVIRPDVHRFHGHQFDRAPEIIAAGQRAVRQALPLIAGQVAGSGPLPSSQVTSILPGAAKGA